MIRLLTLTCVLALGKIAGQQSFLPQLVNRQALSISSYSRRPLAPTTLPPRLQNPSLPLFVPNTGSDGYILPPQLTVRENQPRRQFLATPRTAETMNGNRPLVRTASEQNKTVSNSTAARTSDENDHVSFDKKKPTGRDKVNVTQSAPPGVTSERPANSSDQLNVTEVTLDQRASFDGDKCPSGYIRINGSNECIQPD